MGAMLGTEKAGIYISPFQVGIVYKRPVSFQVWSVYDNGLWEVVSRAHIHERS